MKSEITGRDVVAFLEACGYDGDPARVMKTEILPGAVKITAMRLNDGGHAFVANGEIATQVTTIKVRWAA